MKDISKDVPEGHPLRQLFMKVTESSLRFLGLEDVELTVYISDILVRFTRTDNLYGIKNSAGERLVYLVDMLIDAVEGDPRRRRDIQRHIGDYTLFTLGLFPESLHRPRRSSKSEYYLAQGKQSYRAVAEIEGKHPSAGLYRKLSDNFESCAHALNMERDYLQDPFYRYISRQMGW